MPDDELALRIDAVANLAVGEVYLDRFEEGAAHGHRGLAVARATSQGELVPVLIPAIATNLFSLGRLAEAAEVLDGALEGARLARNTQALAWALVNRAVVAMMAGELEAALACADEAMDITRDGGESLVWCYAGATTASILMEMGEHARAVDLLVERAGGDDLPRILGTRRAYHLDRLSRSRLALGRREDAERAAAAAQSVASALGLRLPVVMAHRAAASLALDAGDPVTAAERALASVAAADEIGARLDAGVSRTLAGRALAAAGEPERAVQELERAAAELEACGARRLRDAAERELGKLGRRRHRRTRPGIADGGGVESLTERELQVARLIVDRRTNSQIAAEL
jgi:tetratricopeptide (TPR) repeat protein